MTDLNKDYSEVLKQIDQHNNIGKWKRFYPIVQQNKNHNFTTIGLHDYKTKKYYLSDLRSHDAIKCIQDMKKYLQDATDALEIEMREAHRQEKKQYDTDQKQRTSSGLSHESFEDWKNRIKYVEFMEIRNKVTS